jgi:hypothetical protein
MDKLKGLIVHGAIEKIANYILEYTSLSVGEKEKNMLN